MTREAAQAGALGPLGRRLLVSFVLVAALAVALVAAAGLVGSNLGLSTDQTQVRRDSAERLAEAAGAAYRQAGGWQGADLTGVRQLAAASSAGLLVLDAAGRTIDSSSASAHPGMAPGGMGGSGMPAGAGGTGMGPVAGRVSVPVVVDGATVGTVTVGFGAPVETDGRRVAWSWILAAALAALTVAGLAGWAAVRLLTAPLVALTAATRAFAAGDTLARPAVRGIGELGELADAFDEAATAVQRSDQSRRQMAADVAHELRTPLAALQAGLEELRDGLAPPDPATLARLHDQALRLGRTVSELADLSAADAADQDLAWQRVDLTALVESSIQARAPQLRATGLDLTRHLTPTVTVDGDPDRLHQIVGNLLDNCVRHCRPGDHVTVSVTPAQLPDHTAVPALCRLTVQDTGPGIPPEDLPQVLTRFWRGRDRHTVAGSGIGLAVVARLVHAHHGQVHVASDGATGTTVTVELPLRRRLDAPAAPGPNRSATRQRVPGR